MQTFQIFPNLILDIYLLSSMVHFFKHGKSLSILLSLFMIYFIRSLVQVPLSLVQFHVALLFQLLQPTALFSCRYDQVWPWQRFFFLRALQYLGHPYFLLAAHSKWMYSFKQTSDVLYFLLFLRWHWIFFNCWCSGFILQQVLAFFVMVDCLVGVLFSYYLNSTIFSQ